jgi:hypothetical protein
MRVQLQIPDMAVRVSTSDQIAQQFADMSHAFHLKKRVHCCPDCIVGQRRTALRAVRKLHFELSAAEAVVRRAKRRSHPGCNRATAAQANGYPAWLLTCVNAVLGNGEDLGGVMPTRL